MMGAQQKVGVQTTSPEFGSWERERELGGRVG
jgi:hypothetical protein